jgi:hypothetical protein
VSQTVRCAILSLKRRRSLTKQPSSSHGSPGCEAGIDLHEPGSLLCAGPPNMPSSLDYWPSIQEAIVINTDPSPPDTTAQVQCPAYLKISRLNLPLQSHPTRTTCLTSINTTAKMNSFPKAYLPCHSISSLVVLLTNPLIFLLIAQYRAAGTYAQPVSKESIAAYLTITPYISRQSRT